jgi:lysophospholipase
MLAGWRKDEVLTEISKFDFSFAPPVGEKTRQYCQFYQIDFEQQIKGVQQQVGWFDADHYRLVLHYFAPKKPKATVFVFHGYFDHTGLYGHLIRHLLEQHYAVVMYDLPGHGLSSGAPTAISSFEQYQKVMNSAIALCAGNVPEPFYAIGQSTGGAQLLDYLLCGKGQKADRAFKKIVLLAPLVRPMGWKMATMILAAVKPFMGTWKRTFSISSNDSRFIRFVKEIDPLQSKYMSIDWIAALKKWISKVENAPRVDFELVIIQGRKDLTVDWRHNIPVIEKKISQVDVHYLPDGHHHLVNESAEIREDIFAIINTAFNTAP